MWAARLLGCADARDDLSPPDPDERQRIIDATLVVIAKQGLRKAKLATIADKAGIAYGTLYRHFRDRDDLLLAAMTQRAELVRQDWESLGRDGDVIKRIIELGTAPVRRNAAERQSRDLYVAMLLRGSDDRPRRDEGLRVSDRLRHGSPPGVRG